MGSEILPSSGNTRGDTGNRSSFSGHGDVL